MGRHITSYLLLKSGRLPCVLFALLLMGAFVRAEGSDLSPTDSRAAQIVALMAESNQRRTEGLRHYSALRHYELVYRGFPTHLEARMEVEVNYDAPHSRNFRIISTTGSKLLIDRVLKRLVESEKEASADSSQTALTEDNYRFQFERSEVVDGREAYILHVEPVTDGKFLYRGRIWVDATDYAMVKLDAEPARRPSLWIAKTRINATFANTGGFWLPLQNRSETRVRVGGTAVLTIDYGTYSIQAAPVLPVAPH